MTYIIAVKIVKWAAPSVYSFDDEANLMNFMMDLEEITNNVEFILAIKGENYEY